jgi:hypothetical protein
MGAMFSRLYPRALSLFLAMATGSCATVDQFGSRAYDGNLNVQDAINQEVLLNIIRASEFRSISWNPTSQVTGGQTESLTTGLPTINFGPSQIPLGPYSISNSVNSGVTGGYTSAPLLTTTFQTGMLTPVSVKTFVLLSTYYPREAIFYSLIDEIDVKSVTTGQYARLVNDPAQDYFDITKPSDFDEVRCHDIVYDERNPKRHLFPGYECSYSKFRALMQTFIEYGLSTEVLQYATSPSAQNSSVGASLTQTTQVSEARLCFNPSLKPDLLGRIEGLPVCGETTKPRDLGGSIAVTKSEVHKAEDAIVNTDTQSTTRTITTTKNALLPVKDLGAFNSSYRGVGPIQVSLKIKSPNSFLSFLGSWYKYADKVRFSSYRSVPAQRIFGDGPYISILNSPSAHCYSSINYDGQIYCVPPEATHTAMLMDIAVVLRNLNVSPADLNTPLSVRFSQ